MFGTLHLSPPDAGPVYVEKADGATFSARECHVPHHTACDQCRQRKLRCNGGKPRCNRCSASQASCAYSEVNQGATRRLRQSRKKTMQSGEGDGGMATPLHSESGSEQIALSKTRAAIIVEGGSRSSQHLDHDGVGVPYLRDASNVDMSSAARQDGFLPMVVDSSNVADFQLLPNGSPGPSFHWSPVNGHEPGPLSPFAVIGDPAVENVTVPSGIQCTSECLGGMDSLLEELEACLHDMGPCKADATLAFQKRAYVRCFQIVNCQACYVDSDAIMLLVMICDKMVMLNKKILWYTKEDSHVEKLLTFGEYEMDQQKDWAGVIQVLTATQLRQAKQLVDRIEASPAIQGKQAQVIVLRSVKQQVVTLLGRVKAAMTARIFDV